jgi:hypothetical protein
MHIDVIEIIDLEDGGANIVMELDREAIRAFATKGLLATLKESVADIDFVPKESEE